MKIREIHKGRALSPNPFRVLAPKQESITLNCHLIGYLTCFAHESLANESLAHESLAHESFAHEFLAHESLAHKSLAHESFVLGFFALKCLARKSFGFQSFGRKWLRTLIFHPLEKNTIFGLFVLERGQYGPSTASMSRFKDSTYLSRLRYRGRLGRGRTFTKANLRKKFGVRAGAEPRKSYFNVLKTGRSYFVERVAFSPKRLGLRVRQIDLVDSKIVLSCKGTRFEPSARSDLRGSALSIDTNKARPPLSAIKSELQLQSEASLHKFASVSLNPDLRSRSLQESLARTLYEPKVGHRKRGANKSKGLRSFASHIVPSFTRRSYFLGKIRYRLKIELRADYKPEQGSGYRSKICYQLKAIRQNLLSSLFSPTFSWNFAFSLISAPRRYDLRLFAGTSLLGLTRVNWRIFDSLCRRSYFFGKALRPLRPLSPLSPLSPNLVQVNFAFSRNLVPVQVNLVQVNFTFSRNLVPVQVPEQSSGWLKSEGLEVTTGAALQSFGLNRNEVPAKSLSKVRALTKFRLGGNVAQASLGLPKKYDLWALFWSLALSFSKKRQPFPKLRYALLGGSESKIRNLNQKVVLYCVKGPVQVKGLLGYTFGVPLGHRRCSLETKFRSRLKQSLGVFLIRPLAVPLVPLPPGYKYDLLGNCESKIPYRSKVLNLSRALNVVQLRSKALLPKVGLYFGDLSAAQLRSEASLPKGCLFFEKASNKGEVDLKPNKFDFQLNLSGAHLSRAHLSGAHLSETHLSETHLSEAHLSEALAKGAKGQAKDPAKDRLAQVSLGLGISVRALNGKRKGRTFLDRNSCDLRSPNYSTTFRAPLQALTRPSVAKIKSDLFGIAESKIRNRFAQTSLQKGTTFEVSLRGFPRKYALRALSSIFQSCAPPLARTTFGNVVRLQSEASLPKGVLFWKVPVKGKALTSRSGVVAKGLNQPLVRTTFGLRTRTGFGLRVEDSLPTLSPLFQESTIFGNYPRKYDLRVNKFDQPLAPPVRALPLARTTFWPLARPLSGPLDPLPPGESSIRNYNLQKESTTFGVLASSKSSTLRPLSPLSPLSLNLVQVNFVQVCGRILFRSLAHYSTIFRVLFRPLARLSVAKIKYAIRLSFAQVPEHSSGWCHLAWTRSICQNLVLKPPRRIFDSPRTTFGTSFKSFEMSSRKTGVNAWLTEQLFSTRRVEKLCFATALRNLSEAQVKGPNRVRATTFYRNATPPLSPTLSTIKYNRRGETLKLSGLMGQVLKCEKLIGYFMCGAHEFSIHEVTNEVTSKKKDDFHKLSLVKTHWRSDLAFSPTFSPNLPRKSDFRIANLRFATKLLLFRPILHLTRFDINKLCEFYNFPLYADKTNNIDIFRRNRIRTQLLPTLRLFFNKNLDFTLFRFLEISFYEKNFFDNLSRSLSKKVVGRLYRISQNFCPILENELCVPVSDEDLSEALKVVPSWKDQAKGAKGPKVILSWKGRSKSRRTRKLYCNVLKAGGIRAPVANLRFATRGANQRFAQIFFENKYEISNTFLFFLPKSIRNKILYKILFFNKHIEGRTFLGKMGLKDSITFEEAFIRNQ